MGNRRYVQHISGQGEKYEVIAEGENVWTARWRTHPTNNEACIHLIKSEYRLCDPPEQWEDVTGECEGISECAFPPRFIGGVRKRNSGEVLFEATETHGVGRYRLREVQNITRPLDSYVFIVERKVQ